MKQGFVIVFISAFLFANTAFGELLRLPRLIHHYLEHVEWDQNDSFIDFLATHYAKEIDHPDDIHHDHENLPFKTVDYHSCQFICNNLLPLIFKSVSIDFPKEKKILSLKNHFYYNAELAGIWQPPKIG